jgi:hypothetical protein
MFPYPPTLYFYLGEGSVRHVKCDTAGGRLGGGPFHQRQLAEPVFAEHVRLEIE